ncbi:alpha/beta fold hydrolase [Larsenimonas suaedae]|uniref:Alpha/beta hydrolase n=1 Tax=Larsenimonas suaedae TaxID=1851019 RepID=A0ABU1GXD2_9GAMM|nr:alpha/beta hydrolase [Larsenimonas suaedae]MCM2971449.1 alpha/beta fold hydrolase [Larsenimonas suaedae]MDR5896705.1 alpha/beta hydrolase [Larsenimonas suaedae]
MTIDEGFAAFDARSLAGGRLAALTWGDSSAPLVLALHGWLDNAMSFTHLAPELVRRGYRVVALDFSGHGHSQWLPGTLDYALWDYVHDVLDALDELTDAPVRLLGHSMGASVALLTASIAPERVERLWLLDGLGMLVTPEADVVQQMRRAVTKMRRGPRARKVHSSVASAVRARVSGGVTALSEAQAECLVPRNLSEVDDGVVWRTDPRLLYPSLMRFTPAQRDQVLSEVACPVTLIEASSGVLGAHPQAVRARRHLSNLDRRMIDGGHHVHLDPDKVTSIVDGFFNEHVGTADNLTKGREDG